MFQGKTPGNNKTKRKKSNYFGTTAPARGEVRNCKLFVLTTVPYKQTLRVTLNNSQTVGDIKRR